MISRLTLAPGGRDHAPVHAPHLIIAVASGNRAPLGCFTAALEALACTRGVA